MIIPYSNLDGLLSVKDRSRDNSVYVDSLSNNVGCGFAVAIRG